MNDLKVLIADGNTEAQAKISLDRGTQVMTLGESLDYLIKERYYLDPDLSTYEDDVDYIDSLIEAVREIYQYSYIHIFKNDFRLHLHNCSIINYEGVFYFIEYIL